METVSAGEVVWGMIIAFLFGCLFVYGGQRFAKRWPQSKSTANLFRVVGVALVAMVLCILYIKITS
jgi:hypothetical protein